MICPSCKGENPPLALRCALCQVALPVPSADSAVQAPDALAAGGDSSKKPSSESRPTPRSAQGDLTIENAPGPGHARKEEGPGVSILSKTPSGAIPPRQSPLDNLDPNTLMGNEGVSPVSTGSRPTFSTPSSDRSGSSGAPEPGMDFGTRFHIEKLLGAGGMGKVYRAFDKELSRTVALKTLQPDLISDPTVIQRFKQELLLASRISHKNILRIHDLNDFEGTKYITMAFIEGQDLNQILKEAGPLPLDRTLKFIRQLCGALDAAHSEGVIHRDFKPHNVLVGKDDQVYVSDFGLATSLESAQMGMTRSGAVVGTPRYMSPEQVEGKRVDNRTDIYSLGIVFYEMVTGQVPFSGESTWQLMYQRVQQAPIDVKEVKPDLPDYVARVIMHCLEKDPANRYQTAREIVADLDANRSPSLSTSLSSKSQTSRSVQINIPIAENRWWYAVPAGGILAVILFFAIPKSRHWVFPPTKTAVSTTTAAPVNGLPSIAKGKYVAVLPFRVIGDQSALGYVADGVVEAISAKLFQIKDVRLTAPAAAAKTDPKMALPQVAKELGVNLLVHGTVQGTGDKLRITVTLDNMAENRIVWSQEFAGVTGDLLTLEDQIYGRIVDALEMKPSDAELAAATAHPTENIEAYNLYLRGRSAMSGNVDDANTQAAMNYYNGALQKDPGFSLAYAGLADANLQMYFQKKDKFWSDKAIEAAKQAERLNSKLSEVHFTLGSVYAATGQTVQAITENKRALELAPNSDEAYRRLGNAYIANNQKDEALRALEKAVELNPYYWNNLTALGNAYLNFGEPEKAAKLYAQTIQLEPDNPAGYSNLATVYFSEGKYEESITSFQKALKLKPTAAIYSNLGTAFFYLKRYPEMIAMFEKAVEMSPTEESLTGNLADGYRMVGNKQKAQETYDKAISLGFKELRVNPRNSTVVGNLALYYAKKGDLEQAREFIKKARAMDRSDVYLLYSAAVVDAIDNKPAEAVKELKTAVDKGFSPKDVAADPEFASLNSRPDFQALITRPAAKVH
jgi:serine/threonine protein kinase/tetratricopeptide (TPR) repeat protein/TolB-like protein